ncbi:alpha-tocopherol transfer protein-like [Galleria mellonella]|uniref:Alpha-tocopherol transfer protein-like n=1 Tax=Galleria mellonella TaxID=7137 RepID=A0A6J1WPC8_GALME|nr:alpha-tocopherol transfer protein-like [Galleria mellonella]
MSIRPLSPELAEKARVELNEDPRRLKEDLQHLKDWIAKQPHLRVRTDDQWLTVFLRGCKYSLERTKQKLDLFYTFRNIAPEFFRIKHTDPYFYEIFNLGIMIVLPKPIGPTSPIVGIFRPGPCDPKKYDIMDVMAATHVLQKVVLVDNDHASVAGFQSIMDLEGTTMAHFTQMTPFQMKKMMVFSQDAAPIRMKGFHYLNTPPGFETVFNLVKGFMNEKNRSRLHVHNKNYDELYKHIPKEVLPAEYGGNGGTIEEILNYWKKKVQEYDSWLEEDEKYGVDESKRPGKPKTAEDLLGIDGTFRKLDFD